ncbi:MAG: hypothetical protein M0Z52_13095 [Actinomycetota bacterium]|nr:hypothetical protein [Actinomycetota bacterium]
MHEFGRLTAKNGAPRFKNLVFTSAGDSSNIHNWLIGNRNFDLWTTYYGDKGDHLEAISDFYNRRKGGKFPNLHYAYRHWKDILDSYEAVMIMDDDIIIDARGISRLFEIRERFGLWLLQPAFSPLGRITIPITCARPFTMLRYTNFVEMTCPLILKSKLDEFMGIYDPALSRFGVDWWIMEKMRPGKTAIVDEIVCINPHTVSKKEGVRECARLQPDCVAAGTWNAIKSRHNIRSDEEGYRTLGLLAKEKISTGDAAVLALYLFFILKQIRAGLAGFFGMFKAKFFTKADAVS